MLIVPNQEEIAHHTDKITPSKWSFEELRKIPEFGAVVAFLALFIFFALSAPHFFPFATSLLF